MASGKFVSQGIAKRRLEAVGLLKRNALGVLAVEKGVRECDLKIVERAAKATSPQITAELLDGAGSCSGFKQLGKKRSFEPGRANFRKKLLFMLKSFSPCLGKIAGNPAIKKGEYVLNLARSIEPPFPFAFEIKRGKTYIDCCFNFDIFFNRKGAPSVMLGNLQGGNLADMQEFKKKIGQTPLDFFVGAFKKAFPKPRQLVALNPGKHPYLAKLDLSALANSMRYRGKLTEKECNAFLEHRLFCRVTKKKTKPGKELKAIIKKVEAERLRILTKTPGMHAAAYRKAGFRRTRSRTWRLQRKKK